jgi:glycosyltransferase involved in cell wall biosynthesis
VGSGPDEHAIASEAERLGMTGAVTFAGWVPSVWPYLAQAHVFALTSRREALGIAIIEAMAAGLPVVASAVGGISELVTPGETGELVSPGDVEGLASALVNLLESPERRYLYGERARGRAALLTDKAMRARYFALYERSLSAPAPRSV